MKKVFVSGGTGYVGSAVLERLKSYECEVLFSWHNNREGSVKIVEETGFTAIQVDLSTEIAELKEALHQFQPDVFIHCAANCENLSSEKIIKADWQRVHTVNCSSAFEICQTIFKNMSLKKDGDIIFVNGLANSQSFKLPIHFAASQGAQNAMAMALAKEFGAYNIRVNAITLGLLEKGLSQKFPAKLHEDYLSFSALQRKGTAEEVAKAICQFALNNSYVSGKNIKINGGI
jgi:3-oxoacyl-[acyl-carrier protein] reductase